ncbi:MAG TPA: patatin-like phospholipase family protein [Myxococcota bacterium]|nr:patatin-like phospholipase family protein [Myxococcota bacterium]
MAEAQPADRRESRARPKRALVFSGGGARGAYEAGVVHYLVDELPKRLGHPVRFDILCGTSVGAVHACFLAATAELDGGRGSRLVEFWKRMRIEELLPISARDVLRLPQRLLGIRRTAEAFRKGNAPDRLYGLLNTEPLEQLVVRTIPWRGIRENIRNGLVEAVCVAATQIASGRVAVFIEHGRRALPTWTRDPLIVPHPTRLLPAHALASAAIPLLFPAVRIGSTYYADGGLRLNTPLAPAIRLGADRVLVVALRPNPTASQPAAVDEGRVDDYASPTFLLGKMLNALLLDHVDTDLARMHVMNEVLSGGTAAFGADFVARLNQVAAREGGQQFRRIDDLVIRPTRDLGIIASQVISSMPKKSLRSPLLRLAMRSLEGRRRSAEADLLSYLLFDGEFLGPLAELGYHDARAHEREFAAFFSDEPIERDS